MGAERMAGEMGSAARAWGSSRAVRLHGGPARAAVLAAVALLGGSLVAVLPGAPVGAASLSASPSSLVFVATPGVTRTQGVTITNTSTSSVTVYGVAIGAADSLADVASGFAVVDDSCAGASLPSNGSCSFGVAYTPDGPLSQSADAVVQSSAGAIDVPLAGSLQMPYEQQVTALLGTCSGAAAGYWPLDEPGDEQGSENTAYDDSSCHNTGSYLAAFIGTPSPLSPGGFYGNYPTYLYPQNSASPCSCITTTNSATNPETFTIGAWVDAQQINSSYGDLIIGFSNNQTSPTSATNYDRLLYIDTSGYVRFGIYNSSVGKVFAVTSGTVTTNTWYFIAAVLSNGCATGASMAVYVYNASGSLVTSGSNTSNVCAQNYTGWWTIGASNTGSWPNIGSGAMYGDMIGAFVSSEALSSTQLQSLATAGGGSGLADASLSTTLLDFGPAVDVGQQSPPQVVTVTNQGSAALSVGQVAIGGDDPQDFALASDGCSNTSVAAGGSCSIDVTFRPEAPGNATALLEVPTNGPPGTDEVVLQGFTPNPYRATTLADLAGQPSQWVTDLPLDETQGNVAIDRSGNGNPGYPTDDVGLGVPLAGPGAPVCLAGEHAMSFDGTANAGVTITSGAFVGTNSGGPGYGNTTGAANAMTVEAWVYLTAWTGANDRIVANDHSDASPYDGFELFVNNGGQSGEFAVGSYTRLGGAVSYATWPSQGSGGPWNLNQWYFYVGTFDSSANSIAVYGFTNGSTTPAMEASSTVSGPMYSGRYDVTIGYDPAYNGDPVTGYIADVTILPAALSLAQIQAQYQAATSCAMGQPSASQLLFPNQPVGTSSAANSGSRVLMLHNVGTQNLTVSSVSLAGADPADFVIENDHCNGQTLTPGASCLVEVAFDPTAPGGRSAELVFADSAPGGGQIVALFGTASNPYASVVSGQPPPPYPNGSALGMWPLDEVSGTTAYDISGNQANGTFENSPTLGTAGSGSPVCGQNATATTFNGSNQYVDVASLNGKVSSSQLTVEAWFELTQNLSGWDRLASNAYPQGTGNLSSDKGFELGVDPAGNGGASSGVFFNVGNGSTYVGPNDSSLTLTTGTWYDVIGTYDGSEVRVFFDGSLGAQAALTGSVAASPFDVLFAAGADEGGSGPGNPGSFFPGKIAYVAIFDRAFTAAQVQAHYQYFTTAVAQCGYWRLDEPPGTTAAYDTGVFSTPTSYPATASEAPYEQYENVGTLYGAVAPGQPISGSGAPVCLAGDTAFGFEGGAIATSRPFDNPETFSVAAWFRTTVAGGGIVGLFDPISGAHDRALYVGTNGDLYFGVWTGTASVVASTSAVDDGKWHFAVGTLSSAGQDLYVDGSLVASSTNTSAQSYTGHWWIGTFLGGWPNEGSTGFAGQIADVSVFDTALSASQVSALYTDATSCGLAQASAGSLFFANQPVDSASPAQTVTVDNVGTATLSLGSVSLAGADPQDFQVTSQTCQNAQLAVGATCSVSIAFDPTTTGGRSAVLEVATSGAGGTLEVPLFGAVQVPYTAAVMNGAGAGAPSEYWRLDEPSGYATAYDSSGGGHHASYPPVAGQGSALGSPFVCDPNDTGTAFFAGYGTDGSGGNQAVTTPVVNTSWSQLTVEAWFELTGPVPANDWERILSNAFTQASPYEGFELGVDPASSNNASAGVFFNVGDGNGALGPGVSASLQAGTWYFVAGTYSSTTATDTVYLFTPSGVASGSATTSPTGWGSFNGGNVAASPWPLLIGAAQSAGGEPTTGAFAGVIAQVALYPYALSQAELTAQYQAATSCAEPSFSPSALVFPDQPLYSTSPSQTLTVTNAAPSGGPSLAITSVAVQGSAASGATEFAITSNTCTNSVLAPGSSCSVGVDFSPAFIGVSAPARQGWLAFTDTLYSGAPSTVQEVELIGTVVNPGGTAVCSGGGTGGTGSTSCPPTETVGGAGAPEAFWRLDETTGRVAYDSSGNGHTGYLEGGVVLGQPGSELSDQSETSMGFDGSTGYIDVPSMNGTVTSSQLTVAGWFYPTGYSGNGRIVANAWSDGGCGTSAQSGCGVGFELVLNEGGQSGFFAVGTGSATATEATWQLSQPIALDHWYFYAGTYASGGSVTVTLYEEGTATPLAQASATAPTASVAASAYDVQIGRDPVYAGDYFEGDLDQVAIWPTALSSAQLAAQFEAGQSTFAVGLPSSLSWSATLNGYDQYLDDAAAVTPEDMTEVGYGWDVTATSTQFASGTATLPTNALRVNGSSSSALATTAPSASLLACPSGTTCSAPANSVSYPVVVPAGSGGTYPLPASLFDAQWASGQGEWQLATDWWIWLPANLTLPTQPQTTYTATVVVTLTSGP